MSLTTERPGSVGVIDPHVKRVAIVVVLGSIMTVLDTTIINVALASLSKDLHSPLDSVQWVVSAYLLALAAVIPLRPGPAAASAPTGSTWWRSSCSRWVGPLRAGHLDQPADRLPGAQGVGGGMLMPIGMTILVQAAGRENLPTVMSAIGVPMVLAPVFGPTLGGAAPPDAWAGTPSSWSTCRSASPRCSWPGPTAAPVTGPSPGSAGRLDWLGLVLAAAGTVGITYGLSQSATDRQRHLAAWWSWPIAASG